MTRHWEHFSHQADVGIRGYGGTVGEAFQAAAEGMTAVVTDPGSVNPEFTIPITCHAADPELLLAAFLNAVIYEMATRNALFSRFSVTIEGASLHGEAAGESVDPARHHPAVEVKGATYTALKVAREGDGWVAQCVVDV